MEESKKKGILFFDYNMPREDCEKKLHDLFVNEGYSLDTIISWAISYGELHNRWISVEDELPKETNVYLVVHHKVVCTMWWYDGSEEWAEIYVDETENMQSRKIEGVTHWQYLPQPPKKGE